MLKIYVCENFADDYKSALGLELADYATIVPFPCICSDKSKGNDVKEEISSDHDKKIIICGNNCEVARLEETSKETSVFKMSNYCFHHLTNELLIEYILEKGGYIITNGWLKTWEKRLRNDGFNQETARRFYGEFCKEIVLLDTGIDEDARGKLKEFSEYVGVPYRILKVGIASLEVYLKNVVYEWKMTQEEMEYAQSLEDLKKQGAEYASVLSIIEQITGYTKKRDIINKIKELFQFIFGANKIRFLEAGENDEYFLEYIEKEFGGRESEYVVNKANDYIVVKLTQNGETFGALEVGDFLFSENIYKYANFATSIARVSALAISNSSQYEMLERSRDEVTYISFHDSLTDLHNRNYFNKYVTEHRIAGKGAVFVCDIDGLKRINDELGHSAGDDLIIAAGQALKKAFRETDIVSRVGGDEFYIIMEEGDTAVAEKVKRRIQAIIDDYNSSKENEQVQLSLSVGCFPIEELHVNISWEELIHEADKRMYTEKTLKKSNQKKGD